MHWLAHPDTRRMLIGGPPTPGEGSGPCNVARRHAPLFFALLAAGLVVLTVMTRHGEGGSSNGGGGSGAGLPHLTGAEGPNAPSVDKGSWCV